MPSSTRNAINCGVACCPVGGEYINGAVIGRLRMECVLHDTSISYAFVIHLLPCATKLCCFVDIAVIVAAARGEGESSKHHKSDSPEFHCFHFYVLYVTVSVYINAVRQEILHRRAFLLWQASPSSPSEMFLNYSVKRPSSPSWRRKWRRSVADMSHIELVILRRRIYAYNSPPLRRNAG